ncbi:MAG: CocE/NonD family hydrolase [Pseudomonadota bacterium]
MKENFQTLKAAWPVLKSAIARGQLFSPQCQLTEVHPDVEALIDVSIPMPEGYELTANIFRSKKRIKNNTADPVVMCAHPYDNHSIPSLGNTPLGGPPKQYRLLQQSEGRPEFSKSTSWESPDPSFWIPAGYTLVNLNLPGFANSGGPASIMSEHQGQSYRDAIEWVGRQAWCDGNVGLCGVSFLCISQYLAAAVPEGKSTPKALKCIIPWEGISDLYQDLACRGGVSDMGFLNFWWHTEVKESMNNALETYFETEECIPLEAIKRHPFYDDYWKAKAPPLENIKVPMLICASFSDHELHTLGSFRAFEKASSEFKWLYTHRSGKWTEFYKKQARELQKEFMDHFLRGYSNSFPERNRIRIEVRSKRDQIKEIRWEKQWPLEKTEYKAFYLTTSGRLSVQAPTESASMMYNGKNGQLTFTYRFSEPTELTGYIKLKVWIEVRADLRLQEVTDDLIVCCFVEKLDKHEQPLRFYGSVGQDNDMLTRGYARASRRELDPKLSREFHPVITGTKDEKLSPGQIVPLEVAFCPSSTYFEAEESVRLIIAAKDIVHAAIFKKDTEINKGTHVVHIGGRHDSYLLLPVIRK